MVDIIGTNGKPLRSRTAYPLGPGKMHIENARKELESVLFVEPVQCTACGLVVNMPARIGPSEPPNLPGHCPNPNCRGIDTYREAPRAAGTPPPRVFDPQAAFFLSWMCSSEAVQDLESQIDRLNEQVAKISQENKELRETLAAALEDEYLTPDGNSSS